MGVAKKMIDTSKIFTTNNCGDLKIIKYSNCKNVSVEFLGTGYVTLSTSADIIKGKVKDRLSPSVCGVGFMGIGPKKSSIGGYNTKCYLTWRSMIERCYSNSQREKYLTYYDCTVCIEWHNFQVFAVWYENNKIDGYELDKDIKVNGNRIYSPENCVFVSSQENSEKAFAKNYKFISPQGETVNIYNLAKFCRENTLDKSNMGRLSRGERIHHKGWSNYG